MCDPVSLSIMSTVVGAVGSAANAFGAMNAQKKQKQEVERWTQHQTQLRQQEQARQEALRQQAVASQQKSLADVSAENQQKVQKAEQDRLTAVLQGRQDPTQAGAQAAPVSASDQAIAAGDMGSSDPNTADLAKKINEATTEANQRIAALARVSSYGGTPGGVGNVIPALFGQDTSNIDKVNDFRSGSLTAYGTERAVEPVQYSYTGSPLGQIFSDAFSLGAQGLGSAAGKSMFGSFPSAPSSPSFIGPAKPVPTYLNPQYGHLF